MPVLGESCGEGCTVGEGRTSRKGTGMRKKLRWLVKRMDEENDKNYE